MPTGELEAHYRGRTDGFVPVNYSMEREAVELLRQLAPSLKAQGRFLCRLVYEEKARRDERERFKAALETALAHGSPDAEAMASDATRDLTPREPVRRLKR